jgi:adenosylmethionine-8-amino-7-oxononanoate aminotransferase
VSGRIYTAIAAGTGFFHHGHTCIRHATACAAALAVQQTIESRQLLPRVQMLGRALQQRLRSRLGDHPHIGRGRGLFQGIELVRDRTIKEPFDPALKLHARIKQAAMDEGLMCYPMGGTLDGRRGDHILLAPPFILEESHLDELVDKLEGSITLALRAVMGASA